MMKVSKRDIAWKYLGIMMTLGSNFFMLPFLIKYLSPDYLGLWYVYLSVGSIVSLVDFGFSPTIARSVAYSWSGAAEILTEGTCAKKIDGPNYYLLYKVYLVCKRIYLYMALIAFGVLLTGGSYYVFYISRNIYSSEITLSWLVYCCAIFLNLYFGFYATVLLGLGKVAYLNMANIWSRTVQLIVSIALLVFGNGIIAVAVAYLLNGFIYRYLCKTYIFSDKYIVEKFSEYGNHIDKRELRNTFSAVWYNAKKDGIVSVSNFLTSQASTLVCSTFLSLKITGNYAIMNQIIGAISTLAGGIYSTCQPAMQATFVSKDMKESRHLMSVSMVMFTLLFWAGMVCVYFFVVPITVILNRSFIIQPLLFFSMGFFYYLSARHKYYASYISNSNNIPYMHAFCVSGALGVLAMAFLIIIFKAGIWGVVFGSAIAQLCYNNWKWPKVAYELMNTEFIQFNILGIKGLKKCLGKIVRRNCKCQ